MIRIIKCMGLVTIQDMGRSGYLSEGIPRGGWMDAQSAQFANKLLSNHLNCAVFEGVQMDLSFEVLENLRIAITGAGVQINVNGKLTGRLNTLLELQFGDHVRIRCNGSGWVNYIAFSGGIQVDELLGSRSNYLPAGFGGYLGRPIQRGDEIITGPTTQKQDHSEVVAKKIGSVLSVRFLAGPDFGLFAESDQRLFITESFRVSPTSNRMGYRLAGPALRSAQQIEPSPILKGTIQVPMDGQPIILMSDCQTTGGYSRIGQVIRADQDMLAQMKPGSQIRFRKTSLLEARKTLSAQNIF